MQNGTSKDTAGAAAACLSQVVRIVRSAKDWIESLRTETKFGHVGLAHDDRSSFLLPLDDPAIKVGYVVFVQRRAVRGADALRFVQIFDGNR